MTAQSETTGVERRETAPQEAIAARNSESGRIGYLFLYLLGAPIGLILLLWVVLGDNIFGAG